MYPNSIKDLIENFKNLPGIGGKTAERLTFSMIDFDKKRLTAFSDAIIQIRDKVCRCEVCGNFSDEVKCSVCSDSERDHSMIFVVEKPKDIILFERLGVYRGVYHVLNGLISPLDGVGPDDINISKLIDRIDREQISEIILAVKPSVEGETTSLYISRLLNGKNVKVTKIAHGVPLGADIDYIDTLTLELAIEDRKEIIS